MLSNNQISLIVCSRENDIPSALKDNIAETIGFEYELVVIDNSGNKYNIFQAYNEGVRRAQGDVLCFMHDDILFRTDDWGKIINSVFADETIGLVGFAGTHFLPSSPFYWSCSPFITEHNLQNDNGLVLECFKDDYYNEEGIADLVAVDGFCFFIRKKLFEFIRFDDQTYSGFHAYDMDICMQVLGQGLRVCACNKVLIEHFWSESAAATKKGYEILDHNLNLFVEKFMDVLPVHRGINGIPDYVWHRLDVLFKTAYDAKKARSSKAYRLGKALLHPFSFFK